MKQFPFSVKREFGLGGRAHGMLYLKSALMPDYVDMRSALAMFEGPWVMVTEHPGTGRMIYPAQFWRRVTDKADPYWSRSWGGWAGPFFVAKASELAARNRLDQFSALEVEIGCAFVADEIGEMLQRLTFGESNSDREFAEYKGRLIEFYGIPDEDRIQP